MEKALEELFSKQAHEVLQETIEISRYLHMHPEIGFDTQNTERLVKEHLTAEGIEILPGRIGVFGLIRGKDNSRMVALRADMDALCLQEEKNEKTPKICQCIYSNYNDCTCNMGFYRNNVV